MLCQNCGGQIADGAKFCPLCGKPVENFEKVPQFCPKCGATFDEDDDDWGSHDRDPGDPLIFEEDGEKE